jgi:arsenite-transporting ATPase
MAPSHGHGTVTARRVPLLLTVPAPAPALGLRKQRVLFVGGKGGVGKTTIASALGVALAQRGVRCLLVSTDPAHSLGDLFDTRIGDQERALLPNLYGREIDPERQTEHHLETVRRSLREFVRPEMYAEVERQIDLARLSPGGMEAALLEAVATVMVEASLRYDRVIFDTAPTGQTLRLLSLPSVMTAWTDGLLRSRRRADALGDILARVHGDEESASLDPRSARIRETLEARRRTFTEARRLLLDPTVTAFVLVLVPEKLPVFESRKALAALHDLDVPVCALVVNRVLPAENLGAFLEQRREQESRYLREVDELAGDIPVFAVPLLSRDVDGLDALCALAGHLGFGGEGA